MTALLIALGVVVFLAIDAVVIWLILRGSRLTGEFGWMPVPGEATATLPQGRMKLTYQESVHTSSGGEGSIHFYPPSDFEVTVQPAGGGDPLPVDPGMGTSASTVAGFLPGGPRSRTRVGRVEVPAAGQYVIRATATTDGCVEPVLLVGR